MNKKIYFIIMSCGSEKRVNAGAPKDPILTRSFFYLYEQSN